MNGHEARALYLELAAVGCDLRTGEIEPAIRTLWDVARCERLLVKVRTHRDELRELLIEQDDADVRAIREEGRAG